MRHPQSGKAQLYELLALAFGQSAAVQAFNRVARALDAAMLHLLLPCSNYVDDYPLIAPTAVADDTMSTAVALMELLGWHVKEAGQLAASPKFKVLGVMIDMARANTENAIYVANKPERVAEDRAMLSSMIESNRATPALARRLRGRLQYASSQTFGRSGAFAARLMRDLASAKGGERRLTFDEALAARWWHEYLGRASPRKVRLMPELPPVLVLTDGAVEEYASVGGILYDPVTKLFEYFGARVPDRVAESWGRHCGKEQVIGQAEIAPMVLAALIWRDALQYRQTLVVVDNDSAKDAAVRGYSPSLPSAFLVAALWQAFAAAGADPWFDRVPGPSNLADGPSRLEFQLLSSLGAKQRKIEDTHWERVKAPAVQS